MKGSKKGLSELITIVLLIGIGITAAGTAWHFGSDILSKQETHQTLDQVENELRELEEIITSISLQRGFDSRVIDLPLKGTFTIDPELEVITYVVKTEASSYGTSDVPLNDWLPGNETGVVNENKYGALSVRSLTESPSEQTLVYTLQFRPLEDPAQRELRILDLETPLQKSRTEGIYTLTIERGDEDSYRDPATNKEIITTKIKLFLS